MFRRLYYPLVRPPIKDDMTSHRIKAASQELITRVAGDDTMEGDGLTYTSVAFIRLRPLIPRRKDW